MNYERKHGYTFPGRYEILDRATHAPGADWRISEVLHTFTNIQNLISFGSSVGINENLIAAQYPNVSVILNDMDLEALQISRNGAWNFDDVRPSGLALDSSDDTITAIHDELYAPLETFEIGDCRTIIRTKQFDNVMHVNGNNQNMPFADSVFDLAVAYCSISVFSLTEIQEVSRLLKDSGLYWFEYGLFQINKQKKVFSRVLNEETLNDENYDPSEDKTLEYINYSLNGIHLD